jgi:hypothetical protein
MMFSCCVQRLVHPSAAGGKAKRELGAQGLCRRLWDRKIPGQEPGAGMQTEAWRTVPGVAEAPVQAAGEGLSFWMGVSPDSGLVIDVHHPLAGQSLSGAVLVMPTNRG